MNTKKISGLLGVVALASSVTCGSATDGKNTSSAAATEVPAEALDRARDAVAGMGSRLMSALSEQLEAGDPVEAVRVCSEIAPSVGAELSRDGLLVRRVSLKVRNPIDSADSHERAMLLQWEELVSEGEQPGESAEVVTVDGRSVLRYMKPIMVMQPCLTCHGDRSTFEPGLGALLEERYPDDEATGYEAGDLRGAFSVTVDL